MFAFDTSDIVPICRTLSNANDKFHCREDIPLHILETRGASKSSRNTKIIFCIVSTSEKVAWCPPREGNSSPTQDSCQIQQSLFYFSSYTIQILSDTTVTVLFFQLHYSDLSDTTVTILLFQLQNSDFVR